MDTVPAFPATPYALVRALPGVPFADALTRTRAALATQGFGVLTEIDVRATMKAKLGADMREYVILGACNPPLAFQALALEPGTGLLIPCNVAVTADDAGGAIVAAVDPLALFGVVAKPGMEGVATEVRERLARALDAI